MGIRNLAGLKLGQYKLHKLIGAGGMGAVYSAYQAKLKRYVAIKIISADLVDQPDYLERFVREAETSAMLEHRHIITVHDYGVQQGLSYLVMRLLEGGTLDERLRQQANTANPLPSLSETATLLKQVSSALDYAHSYDVIHRDIKPSNVMFDKLGDPYIVDFGIAKLAQATQVLTASGTVMGTWPYMAPEQWRNEGLSGATDQYALGVMIYQLVSGQLPFEASSPAGMVHMHLNDMPEPPHHHRLGVPEELTPVIERALAKDAGDRFATCIEFARAFEDAIHNSQDEKTQFFSLPVHRKLTPLAAPETTRYPIYKHPLMWVLVVLIAGLTGIIALLSGGESDSNNAEPGIVSANTTLTNTLASMISPADTATLTETATVTMTATAAATTTLSPTATSSVTMTATATRTATSSATATTTPTNTNTATETATATRAPSKTATPDFDATQRAERTAQKTDPPASSTAAPTKQATLTPVPSSTPTVTDFPQSTTGITIFRSKTGIFYTRLVTNQDYRACEDANLCYDTPAFPRRYHSPSNIEQPVVGINLFSAQAYCAAQNGRLPYLEEWLSLIDSGDIVLDDMCEWVLMDVTQLIGLSDMPRDTLVTVFGDEQVCTNNLIRADLVAENLGFRCIFE